MMKTLLEATHAAVQWSNEASPLWAAAILVIAILELRQAAREAGPWIQEVRQAQAMKRRRA
jgi:hypothetical protein